MSKMAKLDFHFFDGVQLIDCKKSDLPNLSDYYISSSPSYQLKYCYIDYFDKYAFFWSNKQYMPFHDWLVNTICRKLNYNCISKFPYYLQNQHTPDIIYKNRYFEVETGLKHSYNDLIKRLFRTRYFTYVVVPNFAIKKRYKSHLPLHFHGRLYTLKELFNLNEL